jgi:hypothetical protein
MSDSLRQLLHIADIAAPPSSLPSSRDLADSVRRRYARRRMTARIGATAMAVAACVVLAILMLPSRPKPPTPIAKATDNALQLAALSFEADLHMRTAESLAAVVSRKPASSSKARRPDVPDVQLQRDRAALLLVYEADQRFKQNRPADAIAAYRRAVELFPQTHWADVARQRLRDIES